LDRALGIVSKNKDEKNIVDSNVFSFGVEFACLIGFHDISASGQPFFFNVGLWMSAKGSGFLKNRCAVPANQT